MVTVEIFLDSDKLWDILGGIMNLAKSFSMTLGASILCCSVAFADVTIHRQSGLKLETETSMTVSRVANILSTAGSYVAVELMKDGRIMRIEYSGADMAAGSGFNGSTGKKAIVQVMEYTNGEPTAVDIELAN